MNTTHTRTQCLPLSLSVSLSVCLSLTQKAIEFWPCITCTHRRLTRRTHCRVTHVTYKRGGRGGVRKRQAWVFICKSTHVSSFYTSRWHIRWCKWYITSSAVVNIRHVVACMAHNVKFVITSLFCFYPSQFHPPPTAFLIFNFNPHPVSLSCFQVPEARFHTQKKRRKKSGICCCCVFFNNIIIYPTWQ